jgi:hypothetical protein
VIGPFDCTEDLKIAGLLGQGDKSHAHSSRRAGDG